MNNGSQRIPQHQVGQFKCPECKDTVFQIVQGAVTFAFDRLDPGKMQPVPVTMFQCLGCHGFLVKDNVVGFKIVHKAGPPMDGDEWKAQ